MSPARIQWATLKSSLSSAITPWQAPSQATGPHRTIPVPVFTMAGAGKWNTGASRQEGASADCLSPPPWCGEPALKGIPKAGMGSVK